MLPLWGGVGPGGFAVVLWHERRKVDSDEWAEAVSEGHLTDALKKVNPGKRRGPWRVLCDNESFLRAPASAKAHRRCGVTLWKMPARSPDLNPVEKHWAWLRKRMRAMDLKDLTEKKPALERAAFKQRVQRLVRTARAKSVAAACVRGLRKVAAEVKASGGGATKG
jgi:hypothetical protein